MQDQNSLPKKKKKLGPLAIILILSSSFFVLFLIVTGFLFYSGDNSNSEWKPTSKVSLSSNKIAVIELKGVIMDSKKILDQIQRAGKNKSIRAVVLRIDSPGGAVAPSQEIHDAVKKFTDKYEKPLVASMGSVAASGGYYVAVAAKKIYANAGTLTGSIGVIMNFANLEKLYEWAKVDIYNLKAGKFKDAGTDTRAMTPAEKALLQKMIDNVHAQFKKAVVEGTELKESELEDIADGRIFSGEQAKELGLVDELGGIDEALHEAALLAQIKDDDFTVVYPGKAKPKWLDLIMDQSEEEEFRTPLSPIKGLSLNTLRALDQRAAVHFSPGLYWIWSGAL